jgi:hypothetical protein
MLSLATIVAHKNNGTVTPSGFVMGFCFAFDIGCLLALGAFIASVL